ncbi:TetR/AcrR family transcriptional regulator [Paenibacillus sp. MSJ-34]|uniref:TetR/AcrR family transcriptional regulator n=1 Tax=Paenibacillus sp. MSJ-34 TaxID=2841529 RepID=UPI001C11745E|nr:TetR/AcrR family transcriptional regulator [Paenibacillus sp. MSJ-34]MBU5441116.1 TetR/AcrR family transcriptional regulator [Paenibacillus sp. MSJ-34]
MLREARKKQLKERIAYEAIELFKQKGYDNVTVEEIASVCGIAKGTFFNYFPKKEHVLLQLADSYMTLMDDIVQRHREGALKERVLRIFNELFDLYLQHAGLLRLTLIETIKAAIEGKEDSANLALLQETLRGMIQEAIDGGSLRSLWDAGTSAAVLAGVFFNTLMNGASHLNRMEMTEALRRQLDVVWGGIADE